MKLHKSTYLNIRELDNGDLKITATKEGRQYIKFERNSTGTFVQIWFDLLEDFTCNGSFAQIMPEQVGYLTEAPLIIDCADYDNYGKLSVHADSRVWYFADYMIVDELKNLLLNKPIVFTLNN